MKMKFAVVLAIVAAMCAPVGLASAAETAPKKPEAKAAGDAQEKPVKELQGDWRPLRAERNGQRESNIPSAASIVVKGDEIKLSGPGDACKLKLDPSKTPAQIDITFISGPDKGKTVLGIYSLKEGRLTICLPPPSDPSAPRPKEFKTQPNDNLELAVLERVADAAPRKWLDKTEKHETTAKYVGTSADAVKLEKTDGKIIAVPLHKLSDIDRRYVEVKRWLEGEGKRAPQAKKEAKRWDAKTIAEMDKAAAADVAGKTEEAIGHYRTVLQMHPDCSEAHVGMGRALMKNGRIDEAIQHFQRALAIDPDFDQGHNDLGLALMKSGRNEEATNSFRRALEINPYFRQAKENLEKANKAAGGK